MTFCESECSCLYLFLEGSPSPEPGKTCGTLNSLKSAKWESQLCDKKLGYICKRGNATLGAFVIPTGKLVNTKVCNLRSWQLKNEKMGELP